MAKKVFQSAMTIFLAAAMLTSSVYPVSGGAAHNPYHVKVDLTENLVFIMKWNDATEAYDIIEHVFICSPGADTPLGYFTAYKRRIDWQYDKAGTGEWARFWNWDSCYVNSCTNITPMILFHGVPCYAPRYDAVTQSNINQMGTTASHGCIRLWSREAAWFRENCDGASVEIYRGAGNNEQFTTLREQLLAEKPTPALFPNTAITEHTQYLFTYYNDTLEFIGEYTSLSAETLMEYNPDLDLTGDIPVGWAIRIKPTEKTEESIVTEELENAPVTEQTPATEASPVNTAEPENPVTEIQPPEASLTPAPTETPAVEVPVVTPPVNTPAPQPALLTPQMPRPTPAPAVGIPAAIDFPPQPSLVLPSAMITPIIMPPIKAPATSITSESLKKVMVIPIPFSSHLY